MSLSQENTQVKESNLRGAIDYNRLAKTDSGVYVEGKINDMVVGGFLNKSRPVNFDLAYTKVGAFELRCVSYEEPDEMINVASQLLGRNIADIPSLLMVLRDTQLLAQLNAAVTNGAPRIINKETPIMSLDMVKERIDTVLGKRADVSDSTRLIISAIISKVLSDYGVIYGVASDKYIDIRRGIIPTWAELKQESVRRLLETAITSVNTNNAIDAKKISSTLLLEPLREVFKNIELALLSIQSQAHAMDILAAGAVCSLLSLDDASTAFNGILQVPAISQAARNYTLVSSFLKSLTTLEQIGSILAAAPLVTIRDDLAKAHSAITESGRIRESDLNEFVNKSERSVLDSITGAPLQVLIAPKYNLDALKINASLVDAKNDGANRHLMVPMPDVEQAFSPLLPPVISLVSGGVLSGIVNIASFVSSNHFTSDKLGCCEGAELFNHKQPLIAIGAEASYVEHMAVATAEVVHFKQLFNVETNCVTSNVEVWDPEMPAVIFQSTRKRTDPANQLTLLDGDVQLVTTSPAVLFAYGTHWTDYEPALASWSVGSQILSDKDRRGYFEGKIKPTGSIDNHNYLIPNSAAKVNGMISITFPTSIMGDLGARTVTVDMADMLVGVEYPRSLGEIYVHQIPVLRSQIIAYFNFLFALPYKKGQSDEVTISVASKLEPLITSIAITRFVNAIKTKLIVEAQDCDDKLKMRALFRKQRIDVIAAMELLREMLAKAQLIDLGVYNDMKARDEGETVYSESSVMQHLAGKIVNNVVN